MGTPVTVADYLFKRLKQIGIDHIFGVPGDYNLWLLEELYQKSDIEWSSNSNELNAAYAADGYARVKGVSALITTFGVGELSALNGVAGSAAESVPVIHIVGAPPLSEQKSKSLMHHTFGDGDFERFLRIYSEVTVASSMLTVESAVSEIDRVIELVLKHKQPGYLVVPMDVVNQLVSPDDQPTISSEVEAASAATSELRDALGAFFGEPKQISLIAGHLADRFGAKESIRELIEKHNLISASLLMGKGVVDETSENNIGLYVGGASEPEVKEFIEGCDLIVAVGVKFTDAVTGGFTDDLDHSKILDVQASSTRFMGVEYQVGMHEVIQCLSDALDGGQLAPVPSIKAAPAVEFDPGAQLNQKDIWKVVEQSLSDNDTVVADLGTTFFGAASIKLPKEAHFFAQPLWGSIGYSIPAAYGVKKASPNSRVLLIVGDGSALLTAQEIGVIMRDELPITILLINNDGYTIERLICNPERSYHDVPTWDWKLLPALMGKGKIHETHTVSTNKELADLLADRGASSGIRFVEALLPKLDAPALMTKITNSITNKKAG
ncbi:indolepyruvate decarboxylase [Pseudomonas jessenii]|uniref:Indolepyruvate decarboxylase n=1 Tax=Pseudomonas jessenii TaxID=77298 RepID=A0A2W0EXI2_PSEJE|nr:thiamine pyrophosphate-binding protein [Pseudomonas jessenii]PYY69821.1 indolepyruvate decarboxylase [Pseudomonas jessenii]